MGHRISGRFPRELNSTLYQRGDSVSFVPDMFFVNGVVVPQCSATVTTNCSDGPGMTGEKNCPAGATNDPGNGSLTLYYTNQTERAFAVLSRSRVRHHAAERLCREAGAYLITDNIDAELTQWHQCIGGVTQAGVAPAKMFPAEQIPLVIQGQELCSPESGFDIVV